MRIFFKKLFSPLIWGNILVIALLSVLLIYGVKYGLDRYTHHGQEIEVINVTNRLAATAIQELQQQGLTGFVADSSYDRTLPPGVILEQRPAAGAHVKAGREIILTINSHSSPTIKVPDILGNCSKREALERLKQLGFKIGEVEYVCGDKDWVYGMRANGRLIYNGEKVPIGATINLQVGQGFVSQDTLGNEFEETDNNEHEEFLEETW